MKKRFVFFLALILSLVLPLQVFALVQQSESFYVCDDAGVLSGELENKLISLNAQLESQCRGAQLVVVSVEYMDGLYADEYAYSLMNDWGVGSATENNGMLLLFATKENKGWLAVGAGIVGSFGEDAAEHYLDQYFWDEYDRGNYEEAVSRLTEALGKWYSKYYGTTPSGSANNGYTNTYNYAPAPAQTSNSSNSSGMLLLLLLIVLFLLFSRSGRRGFAQGLFYRPRSGLLNYLFWNSIFRSNNNNNHRPPRSGGGFGGGGFGGGMGHGGGGHSGGGGGRR